MKRDTLSSPLGYAVVVGVAEILRAGFAGNRARFSGGMVEEEGFRFLESELPVMAAGR